MSSSLEDIFHACQLALHVPDSTVALPNTLELDGTSIFEQLQRGSQREQAFFGAPTSAHPIQF